MPPEEWSHPSRRKLAKRVSCSVLRFCRSAIAEWLVYVLLFYSTTAVVTLFFFLPLDHLFGLYRGDPSAGAFVDFHSMLFFFPSKSFHLRSFQLPTRVLLVALWATTARPALALAGCIVSKKLPAYTYPSEQYPPIRWLFEIICCFANRHHWLVPDVELYTRQMLSMLDARITAGSHQLGTISLAEHDELRTFSRMHDQVLTQYSERKPKEPQLFSHPFRLVEMAHHLCALYVLQKRHVTSSVHAHSDNRTPSSCEDAQSALPRDMGTTWKLPDRKHVLGEAVVFSVTWIIIVSYWGFRPTGDMGVFLFPHALDGKAVTSAQEWYDRHIAPTTVHGKEDSKIYTSR